MSSDSEEEIELDISTPEVASKYKQAAEVANYVTAAIVKECVEGKSVVDLCDLGDKLILEGVKKISRKVDKGIAFPTSISVNHIAGHFSPEAGTTAILKDKDVVKIDLAVHVDGYIAVSAHTAIVGNTPEAPATGKVADAICAAHIAADAILRLLKPGNKNTDIPPVVQAIAEAFKVTTVEAVLSHELKRFVIDGTKVIPLKSLADQAVEEFAFEEFEVYAIDVVVSTGTGKTRELDLRPTIYKRAVDQTYSLKLQAARKLFSEINNKYPALPFVIRAIESKHARFGLSELEKHGLLYPYPILYEKEGEIVAQFKYTALVHASGATRITGQPLPYVKSEYSIEDEKVKGILAGRQTSASSGAPSAAAKDRKKKRRGNKKPKKAEGEEEGEEKGEKAKKTEGGEEKKAEKKAKKTEGGGKSKKSKTTTSSTAETTTTTTTTTTSADVATPMDTN